MQTKEDLLALLNRIKQAELVEMGILDEFHPFTCTTIAIPTMCFIDINNSR